MELSGVAHFDFWASLAAWVPSVIFATLVEVVSIRCCLSSPILIAAFLAYLDLVSCLVEALMLLAASR